jgi:hypothetical protein
LFSDSARPGYRDVQLAGSWEEGKVLASLERIRRQFPEIIGEHQPLVLRQQTPMGHASRYVLRITEPCDQLRAAAALVSSWLIQVLISLTETRSVSEK